MRTSWHRRAGVAALLLGVALAGCAQAPAPADRHYRLIVEPVTRPVGVRLDGDLLVKRFAADGVLGQRALAYARASAPQALQQYNYRFWSDPPTQLVQQLAVELLRDAEIAPSVVTPQHRVETAYTLVGRIRRLEHLVGDAPGVAVSLELGLYRNAERRLLLLESYEVEQPLAAPASIDGAVAAMNGALVQIFTRFLEDLAAR